MKALHQIYADICLRRGLRQLRIRSFARAHRHFATAAKLGSTEAQFQLATDYMQGRGCIRSGSEALRWFEHAARAGHTDAQFEMGVLLLNDHDLGWSTGPNERWATAADTRNSSLSKVAFPNGLSTEKDNRTAIEFLKMAAEKGKSEAQANLGWLFLKGIGCDVDRTVAREWLERAAAHDIGQAAFGLAELYGASQQPEYDPSAARIWLKKAANLGNASAAYNFGRLILDDPAGDPDEAEHYIRKAAEKEHLDAIFELAVLQLKRPGGNDDLEIGVNLLRSAAKSGHIDAAFLLGSIYSRGDRVKPDLREAATWYRRAADEGHVQAQFQIGCLFARGEGIPIDLRYAAKYFEQSAYKGHLLAALNIGIFYRDGLGVPYNVNNAVKWLGIAADGGLSQAKVHLGVLIASGKASNTSPQAGRQLLEEAALEKSGEAEIALARLLLSNNIEGSLERAFDLLSQAVEKDYYEAAELLLTIFSDTSMSIKSERFRRAIEVIKRAANQGSAQAMVLLAFEAMSGKYIDTNNEWAEVLLTDAATQGYSAADFHLGVFYCQRNLHSQDLARGLQHYERAAQAGHIIAQYNVGVMLLDGVGVQPDTDKALKYLKLASEQGLSQARDLLDSSVARHISS